MQPLIGDEELIVQVLLIGGAMVLAYRLAMVRCFCPASGSIGSVYWGMATDWRLAVIALGGYGIQRCIVVGWGR